MSYIDDLLAQRKQRSAIEITWELGSALKRKFARSKKLNAAETLVLRVCTVAHCDGIESILKSKRKSIQAAADFAQARGLKETATILANVLKDKPVPGPVSMSTNVRGKEVPIPVPPEMNSKWAATDLTLSFTDESLDEALLDYVAEHRAEFAQVKAPCEVVKKNAMQSRIVALAAKKSALKIVQEFFAHKKPRIRACVSEPDRTGSAADWLEVPVVHRAQPPHVAKKIEKLRMQHGEVADALLDIYAVANGAEFFVTKKEAGFILLPVEDWKEGMSRVMSWARDVDYQDDHGAIPDYLEHAIPFGLTPGATHFWLLITRGKHAGKVMLSGDDVRDDQPCYAFIGEFFAALLLDIPGTFGSGGYVSYEDADRGESFYPEEYRF